MTPRILTLAAAISRLPSHIAGMSRHGFNQRNLEVHWLWIACISFVAGILLIPIFTFTSSIGGVRQEVEQIHVACHPCAAPEPYAALPPAPPALKQVRDPALDFYTFRRRCQDRISREEVYNFIVERMYYGVSPYTDFPPLHIDPSILSSSKVLGWGSQGTVFERLIREVKPRVIVEMGSFLGASAVHMANVSRNLGRQVTILGVDDFRGWAGFQDAYPDLKLPIVNGNVMLLYQFMQNVITAGFQDVILPVPFSTVSAISKFCQWGIMADLIEVDAAHDFHSAWQDINTAFPLLRPGGVMFGHDYFNGVDRFGVRRAVDQFAKRRRLTVEPDGEHWILRGTHS